jgi:DNA-binding CsgD family transcriptional regulator
MPVSPDLVGRGELLDELQGLVAVGSTVMLLSGPQGVGRSAVLAALETRFAGSADVEVVRVAAVPWESGRRHALLSQLVPDSAELPADVFLAAAALADRLISRRTSRTSLFLVDDAQDADPASIEVLATAVRHHREAGLVVVLAQRVPAGTELLGRAADHVVSVPVLSGPDVGALAASVGLSVHPLLAEQLARHTGGVPAYVVALLESAPRSTWRGASSTLPAPPAVERLVRETLSREGEPVRRLVGAVAVLDEGATVVRAATLAETTDTGATVDQAVAAGLLTVLEDANGRRLQMADPMVRAAVLASLGLERRTSLHQQAAELVTDPAEALTHAVEASLLPDPELADRVERLAVERGSSGEWSAAARLFLLSCRVTSDPRLRGNRLVRAVDALVGAGNVPLAGSYVAELESLPETPLRNAVLGYLAILRGRPHEAGARLERAWQIARPAKRSQVAAVICHRQVLHHLALCDGAGLVTWADRAVELVGPDNPTAVEAQSIRGLGLGSTGRTGEALNSYQELYGHAGRGAVGQRVQMGAGWLHLAVDEIDLARSELETAVPTDYLGGSTRISLWAQAWLARTLFVTGEWDAALRTVRAAETLADQTGAALIMPLVQWTATQVHALRGDWAAVQEGLQRGQAGPRDYPIMRIPAYLARAAVAEARADYAGVLRALQPLTESWAAADVSQPGFWPWPDVYANALVLQGRLPEADAFLRPHESRAVAAGHHSAQARLGYARGRLFGAEGNLPEARRTFENALELLAPTPLVYDLARVNFAYGQTLRRAGKRREADTIVSAAREGYESLGATTYVRRCDRELKAGGVHAVLRDRPIDALTPQEQAVAGLVATGLSNREVAAELFLSVKTVQFHLTSVYAKLGIHSRTELAATRAARS